MRLVFEPHRTSAQLVRAEAAIFIDCDGVINRRRPNDYVLNWLHFALIPGMRKTLRKLSCLKLPMILISNQAVGKGLLTLKELEEITRRLHEVLIADGTAIKAHWAPILFAPTVNDELNSIAKAPDVTTASSPEHLYRVANRVLGTFSRSCQR